MLSKQVSSPSFPCHGSRNGHLEKREEMGGRENSRDNTGSGAEDKVFMSSHVVSFDPGRSQDTSPHHHQNPGIVVCIWGFLR